MKIKYLKTGFFIMVPVLFAVLITGCMDETKKEQTDWPAVNAKITEADAEEEANIAPNKTQASTLQDKEANIAPNKTQASTLQDKEANIAPNKTQPGSTQTNTNTESKTNEQGAEKSSVEEGPAATKTLVLSLDKMVSESCADNMENAISNLPGIEKHEIVLETKIAVVEYNPKIISVEEINTAIENVECLVETPSIKIIGFDTEEPKYSERELIRISVKISSTIDADDVLLRVYGIESRKGRYLIDDEVELNLKKDDTHLEEFTVRSPECTQGCGSKYFPGTYKLTAEFSYEDKHNNILISDKKNIRVKLY